MPINKINSQSITSVALALQQTEMSLWIHPGASEEDLAVLFKLPWTNIWDAHDSLNIDEIWQDVDNKRKPLAISLPEQAELDFRKSEFVRIFKIAFSSSHDRRQQRLTERLKDKIEESSGLLCFIGTGEEYFDDIILAHDMAPDLAILLLGEDAIKLAYEQAWDLFLWSENIKKFTLACLDVTKTIGDSSLADLKNAKNLKLNSGLLEDLSKSWTFLGSSLTIPPSKITQEQFDAFLCGEEVWSVYATHAPYVRQQACYKVGKKTTSREQINFIELVLNEVVKFEQKDLSPNEQLKQIIINCEPGSGTTTLLHQVAMELANKGFPVLVSKPHLQSLGGRTLEHFIIDTQDRWLKNRKGKGTGTGQLPVCLIIDTDGELAKGSQPLARLMQALGRKIFIVRAIERSQDEIEDATNVCTLSANVKLDELIDLGAHLRNYCIKYGLAQLPSNEEWSAFHDGLNRLNKYNYNDNANSSFYTQSLFLIGIYPFLKERVSDENSLEQYYYKKWKDLNNTNAQDIVHLLSSFGVYGLSVPFDTLRRHPKVDILNIRKLNKSAQRSKDIFIQWSRHGYSTQSWYLHMRHPAIGRLLCRSLSPAEGDFPYTAIIPLLKNLSTKEEDLWLAGTLAYRLGRSFKRWQGHFSLETDTSVQRAAREVFNAIPDSIKEVSRTVRHHQGRYHLHVLRACQESLDKPEYTTLSRESVIRIAKEEFKQATKYLLAASKIQNEGEPISYIYNTLATASFALARLIKSEGSHSERESFDDALGYEDLAIKHDPANGQALFQYIQHIHRAIESMYKGDRNRCIELIARAELRLVELNRLHTENRWKNVNTIEAEKQLGSLFLDHQRILNILEIEGEESAFLAKHPEAYIFLRIRVLIEQKSIETAFQDHKIALEIRRFRSDLLELQTRSNLSDVYLYRLFVSDPQDRFDFKARLAILEKIKLEDSELFLQFWHDEAALYCQLDQIDVGAKKLRELNEFRRYNREQWFWLNEKALLDLENPLKPREFVLEVHDPHGGWAKICGTNIQVKYQPWQFVEMARKQPFRCYIRITLNGLQAVPKDRIKNDIEDMGIKTIHCKMK